MASVKQYNSNLIVRSTSTSANITLDAEILNFDAFDTFITGNLHVVGVYDATTVTNTNIQDRDIALNVGAGNDWGVGGNASPSTSGIIIDRGGLANVSLRWNEIYDLWEITTNGVDFSNIATSTTSGITAVVQDTGPRLGGNLITNGFNVQLQSLLTANPPTAVAGNVILYSGTVGSAGSGLFVVNSGTASDELVTKSKAIVYSIIL